MMGQVWYKLMQLALRGKSFRASWSLLAAIGIGLSTHAECCV